MEPPLTRGIARSYFERVNVHCDVLDPVLHTPASTFARCPFLFTVICAVAARHWSAKPRAHALLAHYARKAAAAALIDGWKSVELAQAYILLGVRPALGCILRVHALMHQ